MPTNTDLVKDLPADFEVFGQAVDTSLADLKGGTSGQILAKNSNTDMDFVWIANDQGDITAVNVTSPITGGGSSGAVTVGIDDGTTAQKGAVQLEDSTSSTSTTKAATPNSVKSAYDLANAAIPKSLVDAAGDLIYATADNTPARLAIGTAGQVLKVNSGATAPEWGASGSTFAGCGLTKSAAQAVANATTVFLTFDTEEFDSDAYHSTSSNTSRITIPSGKGGKYLFVATANFEGNGTGQRLLMLYKNGAVHKYSVSLPGLSGASWRATTSIIVSAVATDYFEFAVYQDSGVSLNINGGATDTTFATTYLGA